MKLLLIGDLHGKKANYDRIYEALQKCSGLAQNCDMTIFLGDLNDSKAIIRSEIQEMYKDYFKVWPTPIKVVVGNHDYHNSIECKGHSLNFFNELDNVEVIGPDSPTKINKQSLHAIPYLPEDRFIEKLDSIKDSGSILFLHQDISGATYSSSMPIETNINPAMFSKFKRVFSGHIHKAQKFNNITYVGTPFTESFGESGEAKHVIIYNIKDNSEEMIDLNLPYHIDFEYTIESLDDLKFIKKDLKTKILDNHIARVIIHAPEEISTKIKRALFEGMRIDNLKVKKISTLNNQIRIKDNSSNEEIMESYIKQMDLSLEVSKSIIRWNDIIMKKV